jgi:glycosyltransferase involved in cell wall biosynthesis
MAPFIGACVQSLQWMDGIFIYDDNSDDGSLDIALKQSRTPIKFEKSQEKKVAFERGELKTRNYILDRAFQELRVDIMAIVDADELLSESIKPELLRAFSDPDTDSAALSTWHLYDENRYLHFWETEINGVRMVDPHTRIVTSGKYFTPLFQDGSHPIIEPTSHTVCLNGPYHFHLKYHKGSTFPNYSIYFLPERIMEADIVSYRKPLPFALPRDIQMALAMILWDKMPPYKETPHHPINRVTYADPNQGLIHPKDIKDIPQT